MTSWLESVLPQIARGAWTGRHVVFDAEEFEVIADGTLEEGLRALFEFYGEEADRPLEDLVELFRDNDLTDDDVGPEDLDEEARYRLGDAQIVASVSGGSGGVPYSAILIVATREAWALRELPDDADVLDALEENPDDAQAWELLDLCGALHDAEVFRWVWQRAKEGHPAALALAEQFPGAAPPNILLELLDQPRFSEAAWRRVIDWSGGTIPHDPELGARVLDEIAGATGHGRAFVLRRRRHPMPFSDRPEALAAALGSFVARMPDEHDLHASVARLAASLDADIPGLAERWVAWLGPPETEPRHIATVTEISHQLRLADRPAYAPVFARLLFDDRHHDWAVTPRNWHRVRDEAAVVLLRWAGRSTEDLVVRAAPSAWFTAWKLTDRERRRAAIDALRTEVAEHGRVLDSSEL